MATAVLMSNQKLLTFLQRYEKRVFVSLLKVVISHFFYSEFMAFAFSMK